MSRIRLQVYCATRFPQTDVFKPGIKRPPQTPTRARLEILHWRSDWLRCRPRLISRSARFMRLEIFCSQCSVRRAHSRELFVNTMKNSSMLQWRENRKLKLIYHVGESSPSSRTSCSSSRSLAQPQLGFPLLVTFFVFYEIDQTNPNGPR